MFKLPVLNEVNGKEMMLGGGLHHVRGLCLKVRGHRFTPKKQGRKRMKDLWALPCP